MSNVILVRYGEIHLKGLNRPYFERLLLQALKGALHRFDGAKVVRGDGRYFVHGLSEEDYQAAIQELRKCRG